MDSKIAPANTNKRQRAGPGAEVVPRGAPAGLMEGAPQQLPPYNAREVQQHDSSPLSATVDVFTGIMDAGRLTELRDRAIYDPNSLIWSPVADSATGVLFPDAVAVKTAVESSLRERPTSFKGPKQLDVGLDSQDQHFDRQIHPLAWRSVTGKKESATGDALPGFGAGGSRGAGEPGTGAGPTPGAWYKYKDFPFVGFPNPNYFALYTDAIPTHNLQNLSHAQMLDALRAASTGDFDQNKYLHQVGALMKSAATPEGNVSESSDKIIQVDGGGVNSDPRILERMYDEFEIGFNLAKRIRVSEQSADPRFAEPTPESPYIAEKNQFLRAQDDWFNQVQKVTGIADSFVTPAVQLT